MDWQILWRHWHWPSIQTSSPDELNVRTRFLFFGPLQVKWYV
jgi:hypothetical protein